MKKIFLIPFAFCLLTSYMFSQGTWTQKATFGGIGREEAIGFAIGTKGYIGTGLCGQMCGYLKDFWEYNPVTNIWTQKADFGGGYRSAAVGFSIGNKGYVGTGEDNNGAFRKDFWEYDPISNTWTQKTDFGGIGRCWAIGFSLGTKGYIGVGYDYFVAYKDFWEWNQATDTWVQKTNFPNTRYWTVGIGNNFKGYIGTGVDSLASANNDFWEYNPLNNIWTQKANFGGTSRNSAVGFSISSDIYLGTGSPLTNDFWKYNPFSNGWIQKTNLGGVARRWAVGFSIGSKGYIGTGQGSLAELNDFWEFSPDSITGINELQNQISISVSPNPFSTQTTFTLSKEIKNASLKIFSISGKQEKEFQVSGSKFQVKREDLVTGIYFYQLISETKTIATGKLIIQ